MNELEWSQHYSLIFKMLKGANSKMRDGILPKFKLIQALIVALIVCKNEEDPFKIESTSSHNISPIISLLGFFQTLKGK